MSPLWEPAAIFFLRLVLQKPPPDCWLIAHSRSLTGRSNAMEALSSFAPFQPGLPEAASWCLRRHVNSVFFDSQWLIKKSAVPETSGPLTTCASLVFYQQLPKAWSVEERRKCKPGTSEIRKQLIKDDPRIWKSNKIESCTDHERTFKLI